METHAKKKTPQLYSTMQGESSIQEYSKPLEDLQESTPQVEDPQDDMEKDKSSELNDFVSAIKALGKNAAKSGKVREHCWPGWCFPQKNPLRDMFCDFQRVFPTETQKCFFQVSHR